MSTILQSMIDQAEADARNRAAQALAAEEAERHAQAARARAQMEEALAPELWREMGIDLDELTTNDGAPTVAGKFEIGGHSMIAVADTGQRRDTIRLRIILVARDVTGSALDRDQLAETQINPWISHRESNTQAVAESLRAAVALAPDARLKMAARVSKTIDKKITSNTYQRTDAGHIDRTRAREIKDEIARARALLDDEQVASLRRELYRFAVATCRNQADDRARRDREAARAQALAAITAAAREYAPIYAEYEQAAHDWAQEATSRAWANIPTTLWVVRYGRVIQETDDEGEVYRSAMQEIIVSNYDAGTIRGDIERGKHIHKVDRIEYDGTTQRMIIVGVADMTDYHYPEITLRGAMAYCTTYTAQPAGYYANVPHGSIYRPPSPPTLSETWPEFCERTTGHNPPQTWRAYLDDDGTEALDIPF